MYRIVASIGGGRIRLLAALIISAAMLGSAPAASAFTQGDVNTAIANGVAFFDANQNADGSWGTTFPGAETALALASYGVLDSGKFATLSPAQQTHVQDGLTFLLGTQNPDGSFARDGLATYDTGLALTALSLMSDVPTTPADAVATAIANGRSYLISAQNSTANGTPCQSTGTNGSGVGGQGFCGGWNYNAPGFRSDESNTGFALTGLDVTGGVPADVASLNVGWQRNVQQLTANPGGFPSRNDGGGAYEPGINSGDFSSNANDTGSLLFGFGYDSVPASQPFVQAAITFGNDVLDAYELNKASRTMLFHTGQNEDGACDITQAGCDWSSGSGEGGYHYSLFALVKGLSQYTAPDLTNPTNFYAKAVDLLLTQQNSDGSWPSDPRDDGSLLGATGFAILALGKVGTPEQPITATGVPVSATEGSSFSGAVATINDPDTSATASEYTATIDWGDGTTTSGTITGSAGSFTVNGVHTYAEEGSRTITVTITDVDDATNSASATSTATIADAALSSSGNTFTATEGASSAQTVATFKDADPAGALADYTASINWGDGTTTTGTISASGPGFAVGGSHVYAEEGTFTVTVTITDVGRATTTARGSAHVADAPLRATAASVTPHGSTASGTLAAFTDSDPGGTLSDYSASVNWGDGTTTTGTITAGTGTFNVGGTHTYKKSASFTITVTITDKGGSKASATVKVTIAAPVGQVRGRHVVRGKARLTGVPRACVLRPPTLTIFGNRIASVKWFVGSSHIRGKTVRRGTRYTAQAPAAPGAHHVSAKVTFLSASHTRARTFRATVSGCQPQLPKFTG